MQESWRDYLSNRTKKEKIRSPDHLSHPPIFHFDIRKVYTERNNCTTQFSTLKNIVNKIETLKKLYLITKIIF